MTFALTFPAIDPVLISVGPLQIRWYALAYIFGLLIAWRLARAMAARPPKVATVEAVDDFLVWATLGVVLGGRLGYVLFYNPAYYLSHPLSVFAIWEGGMSFHGGFLGVAIGGLMFVRRHKIDGWRFADVVAAVVPIGLLLGRIANFINGELFGRPSDAPWAMVFPRGGPEPRHPSQLYEAALEGLVLLVVLQIMWRNEKIRSRPGIVAGTFLIGYALARSFVELFREPDRQIGFLAGGSTMGQWLSLPMVLVGAWMIVRALRK